MHNNININVSGPVQPSSQYKTVVLKGNLPLAQQLTEPNTKYVVKHNFEIGINEIYGNLEFGEASMTIDGVSYHWLIFEAGKDDTYTLTDDTCVFIENSHDIIVPSREIHLPQGGQIRIGSTIEGLHQKAYKFHYNGIQIPENVILEFDGGSIDHGTLFGNDTTVFYMTSIEDVLKSTQLEGTWHYNNFQLDKLDNTNGMARIYLKPNQAFGDQLIKENTIYIIQHDFDLDGTEVTIPANCVLEFDGGSLSNGTVVGQNTIVTSKPKAVLFNNVVFSGSFVCENVYASWFGEYTSDFKLLVNMFRLGSDDYHTTYLFDKDVTYDVEDMENNVESGNISIFSNSDVYFNDSTIFKSKATSPNFGEYSVYRIIRLENKHNINIYNLNIVGDIESEGASQMVGEYGHGLYIISCKNIAIYNSSFGKCFGDGVYVCKGDGYETSNNIKFLHCLFDKNRRQGVSVESGIDLAFEKCTFSNTGSILYTAPGAGIDIEPNDVNAICRNIVLRDCYSINNYYGYLTTLISNDDASIVFDNCHTDSLVHALCARGIKYVNCYMKAISVSISDVEFDRCHINGNINLSAGYSDSMRICSYLKENNCHVAFNGCDIIPSSINRQKRLPSSGNIPSMEMSMNGCNFTCNDNLFIASASAYHITKITYSNINVAGTFRVSNVVFEKDVITVGAANFEINEGSKLHECYLKLVGFNIRQSYVEPGEGTRKYPSTIDIIGNTLIFSGDIYLTEYSESGGENNIFAFAKNNVICSNNTQKVNIFNRFAAAHITPPDLEYSGVVTYITLNETSKGVTVRDASNKLLYWNGTAWVDATGATV